MILNKLYSLKYYITNRWIDQSHALVAHREHIPRGSYRDLDDRILYCLFDELVDFVEIEKAYMNFRFDAEKSKDKKWWQVGRWRTRTWRNPEAGIDYLEWEISDTDTVTAGQGYYAKEVLELYKWWKEVYPKRVDPMDASGWSAYCDSKRERGIGFLEDDPDFTKEEIYEMVDKSNELEEQYRKEEDEMLIRLIKIRGCLWT